MVLETNFRESQMSSYFETVLTEPTPRPRRPAASCAPLPRTRDSGVDDSLAILGR